MKSTSLACICVHTSRQGCQCIYFAHFSQLHHYHRARTEANSKDTGVTRIPQNIPNTYSCINNNTLITAATNGSYKQVTKKDAIRKYFSAKFATVTTVKNEICTT